MGRRRMYLTDAARQREFQRRRSSLAYQVGVLQKVMREAATSGCLCFDLSMVDFCEPNPVEFIGRLRFAVDVAHDRPIGANEVQSFLCRVGDAGKDNDLDG